MTDHRAPGGINEVPYVKGFARYVAILAKMSQPFRLYPQPRFYRVQLPPNVPERTELRNGQKDECYGPPRPYGDAEVGGVGEEAKNGHQPARHKADPMATDLIGVLTNLSARSDLEIM